MTEKEQHLHKPPVTPPKNGGRRALIWGGPLIIAAVGGFLYLDGGRFVDTDNAYLKAAKVSISAEVSGRIAEVAAADNQQTQKGALLFRVDKAPFEIAVLEATANLANVRSEIEGMKGDYLQKQAAFEKAQEDLNFQEKEYVRARGLKANGTVSVSHFDEIEKNRNAASREVESARQEMAAARARLIDPDLAVEEHPRYKGALAHLDKAQLDLQKTDVTAPIDGTTANVTMQTGEYIITGVPLFSIVDGRHIWIEANFKETDLTHVKKGQPATVAVDTYPGKVWQARVESITPASGSEFSILPAQNSSGSWVKVVQRIMVRLELDDGKEALPLAAGMSATVSIDTGHTRFERIRAGDQSY